MLAPAKVNLYLHVGPVKENGRHDLDSLVMFAGPEASDRVEARKAATLSLTLEGPFAGPELASPENLVLRAIAACEARGLTVSPLMLTLHKHIPVAAGLGGGSADAGAMLRQLVRMGTLTDRVAWALASSLGGDVPAAYLSRACRMQGEGHTLTQLDTLPDLPALLVNPRLACPTGPVFQAFDRSDSRRRLDAIEMPAFDTPPEMIEWLGANTRNDLQTPAISLLPEIDEVLERLSRLNGCALSRMTGSGATCFALFETRASMTAAVETIASAHPEWWAVPTLLKGA
jgi:4-diphosphocytidyl-2-C-methyl-D-erythritol kinase